MLRKVARTIMSVLLILTAVPLSTPAQSDDPKYEVGGFYSLVSTNYYNSGFGGRFGYNINPMISVEGSYTNYFQDQYLEGKKSSALFGLKFGQKGETAGIFGLFAPGIVKFSNEYDSGCSTQYLICTNSQTHFGMFMGGGFEMYPSHSTYVRFDIGNLWIQRSQGSMNSLLMNVGAGFRF
jgi:hypothetical protein